MSYAKFRPIRKARKHKQKPRYFALQRLTEETWHIRRPEFKISSFQAKSILVFLLVLGSLLPASYAYYSIAIAPQGQSAQGDPFTTLWNGQIPQSYSSITGATFDFFAGPPNGAPNNGIQCGGGCVGAQTYSHNVFAFETVLVVIELDLNNTSCLGVSDSQGNGYVIENCFATHNMVEQIEFATMASTGSVTFTLTATTGNYFASFFGYRGVGQVLPSVSHVVTTSSAAGSDAITTSSFSGILFGRFTIDNTTIGGAVGLTGTARQGFTWIATDTRVISAGESSTIPTITWSWSGMTCHKCFLTNVAIPLTNGQPNTCDSTGYQCFNAAVLGGNIQMKQNSTFPAVALSNSSIDLSQGVGKALTLAFSIAQYPGASGPSQGLTVGWFLRQNGTLPNTAGWTPLKDSAVTLFVMFTVGPSVINYYVYMQRQLGQQLFQGSLTPTCNQVATIFLCATNSSTPGTLALPLELNFTGATSGGGAGVSTASSESYLCTDIGKASTTCNLGGENNQPVSWTNTNLRTNFTLPWLNIQNNYYAGVWEAAGSPSSGTFQWNTAQSLGPNSIISVFTPPASSQSPNIAEGGFFGWVGRSLGGAWNAVAGALGPVVSPILGVGNSILGAIIGALVQWLTLIIQGAVTTVNFVLTVLQVVLNAIGKFAGWGNIGDQFFSFMSGVITYFTTGLGDALGWLLRLILRSIDLIKIANFWVNFYLTGLLNFLADGLNVIAEVVVFGNKIVTFLGSSYVVIIILFYLWYVADLGIAGVHGWFETVKWLAFISFDFLERMINFGISSITWLFGRIPTLDGTTLPELPTIAIGGGPIWPSMEMTALREGNVFSIFFFMVGVVFMLWFETTNLPGSIAANVPAAAPQLTGPAPFINIFLILIAILGLVFVINIPAQLARKTFDLDNLKTSIRSGAISTGGGVSGRFVKRHPERKAQLVINRGLGVSGLRPHLRKPQMQIPKPTSQGVG